MELPKENLYGHTKKLRYIIRELDTLQSQLGRPITVLDFGCGNGTAVSAYIIERGYHYYGIDFHAPSLEYANRQFGAENASFLPEIPDGITFDAIVYADVLEHLPDPLALLSQHVPLLEPHGIVIASVPNGYGSYENERRLELNPTIKKVLTQLGRLRRFLLREAPTPSGTPGDMIPYNYESGHVQFFTKRALHRLFDRVAMHLGKFENASFLCGPFSHRFILKGENAVDINMKLGAILPYWAVSAWYFTAKKNT